MQKSRTTRIVVLLTLACTTVTWGQSRSTSDQEREYRDSRNAVPPVGWTIPPVREEPTVTPGILEDIGDKTEMIQGDLQPTTNAKAWLGDVLVTDPTIDSQEQTMCCAPDGTFFIAVEQYDTYDGWVRIYRSQDNGLTWLWLTSFKTGEQARNPAITYGENNLGEKWLFLAYEATMSDSSKRIMAIRVDPDNTSEWDAVNVSGILTGTTAAIYPRICTDNLHFAGSYYVYVVWTENHIDYHPVMFTRSLDQGATYQTPQNITGGAENSSIVPRPDIAYGTGGLFVAFEKLGWTGSNYDTQVWVRKNTSYGTSTGWESTIQLTTSTEGAMHPAVSAAHGTSSVLVAYTRVYSTDTDINFAYSLDGGTTYSLNNALPWTNNNELNVSLAVSNSDGRFHAVFWHDYHVRYTWTSVTNPRSWAATVIVNDSNNASLSYPRQAICVDPTKTPEYEACAAWTDFRGANYDVYFDARFYDGACCLPDESCVEVTEVECTSLGGTWSGSGIDCTPELCIPDPCDSDVQPPVATLNLTDFDCIANDDTTPIIGTATDPEDNLASWILEIRPSDAIFWSVLDSGTSPVSNDVLANWTPTAAGYHLVRLTVLDSCGHTSTDTRLVYVDRGPPARINYPNDGQVIGGSSVCIDIYATHGVCPKEWELHYQPEGGSWVYMTGGTYGVYNVSAYSWNTTTRPDGAYTIRLTNTSVGGTEVESVGVIIDNIAPVVSITDPVNCTRVDGNVEIHGSVYDANISSWSLQWTGGPSSDWNTIKTGTGNITGLLYTWNTTGLPDCPYTIRLIASDKARINCTNDAHWADTMTTIQLGDYSDDADLDNDGDVDLEDYMLFQGEFTGPI